MTSIRFRFIVTFIGNVMRSGISFLAVLLIARALGPTEYGRYAFLLGSFSSVLVILDLGTSKAFFTLLSQRNRGRRFILYFFAWQAFQLALACSVISLMPASWIGSIWLNNVKRTILLSFCAIFLQNQVWQSAIYVGESRRLTFRIQSLNLIIVCVYILALLLSIHRSFFSVNFVFVLSGLLYLSGVVAGLALTWPEKTDAVILDFKKTFHEFYVFCAPLVLYSAVSFLCSFADVWLLQRFGGDVEQAYFSVGNQFAAISLLPTASILNIFWKEVAEAHAGANLTRVRDLYVKLARPLFFVAAAVSGFLIPWSREILHISLGGRYGGGALVLALMLLYPAHQTLGQLNGALFSATGNTRGQMFWYGSALLVGLPITYFLQASVTSPVPGFGLGSLGMALKLVGVQIVTVNLVRWWFARRFDWKLDWSFQITCLALPLLVGFLESGAVRFLEPASWPGVVAMISGGIIYVVALGGICLMFPAIMGVSREELRRWVSFSRLVTSPK